MTNLDRNTAIPFGILSKTFTSEHYPALFDGKETHDPALKLCAQLASLTKDIAYIESIVLSALPPTYPEHSSQNLLDELNGMISDALNYVEKQPQEGSDEESNIIDLVLNKGDMFHNSNQEAFIEEFLIGGGVRVMPAKSSDARLYIRKLFFYDSGKSVPEQKIRDAIGMISMHAIFNGRQCEVYKRIAGDANKTVIDLGGPDCKVVEITADGWEVKSCSDFRFVRNAGFNQLPEPQVNGDLERFKDLLKMDEKSWILLVAFLINCLKPSGPYMCLLIEGEQGSGKSLTCDLIKRIIDPNQAPKMRLPDNERDLMIQANEFFLLVFDNTSFIKGIISDLLCSLSTQGGFAVRKLYTDDELAVFNVCRPYIINGISNIGNRPDLLERAIHIKLSAMDSDNRRTERDIMADFDALLPEFLGCLYSAVSMALRIQDKITPPNEVRMADAAHWLVAAEEGLGLEKGTILNGLIESQDDLMAERVMNHPVTVQLVALLKKGQISEYVGALFHEFRGSLDNKYDKSFPATPAHFSSALDRLKPALKRMGIIVHFGEKDRNGRVVKIWREGEEGDPPVKIYTSVDGGQA